VKTVCISPVLTAVFIANCVQLMTMAMMMMMMMMTSSLLLLLLTSFTEGRAVVSSTDAVWILAVTSHIQLLQLTRITDVQNEALKSDKILTKVHVGR